MIRLMSEPGSYPIFDADTGSLLRGLVREGKVTPGAVQARRAQHVGTASGLLGRLPNFPTASLQEIVEIRGELSTLLRNFRRSVQRLTEGVATNPVVDPGEFGAEIDEVWRFEVEPSMGELRQAIRDNKYHSQLARAAGDNAWATAATVALAVANTGDLAAALAPLTVGMKVGFEAAVQQARDRRTVGDHQYLFLHRTEERLHRG